VEEVDKDEDKGHPATEETIEDFMFLYEEYYLKDN